MPRVTRLLALAMASAVPAAAQGFEWRDDLTAAQELAARESKPLLLLFRCEP